MRKFILFGFALVLFGLSSAKTVHAAYVAKPGDLLKTQTGHTVYLVDDNFQRIPMTAEAYKIRYNNDFSKVLIVDVLEIGSFATYLRIGQTNSHPDGTLIVYSLDNPEVFVLNHGFKKSLGLRTDLTGVAWVGTYEIYPTAQ